MNEAGKNEEILRYPIGRFQWDGNWNEELRRQWTCSIRSQPGLLQAALEALGGAGLDIPYRPGGWTVRQVVHHMADSHMNCYIRIKLAVTEDNPVIKPYREDLWAELADSRSYPVEPSLLLLESLHSRWADLLDSLSETDYLRSFFHPESNSLIPLRRALAQYNWHGNHHIAHIKSVNPAPNG
ncbi:MAG: metal-dependent hydrolase [Paenibacillaceae bacterium]|jgi:hypothetical protein|nr:metal-dependent hydrolase [Paenibacillaceae bacterium]